MSQPRRKSEFVNISDDFQGYNKDLFCIPSHYIDTVSTVLIPHGIIQERIKKMARNILKDVLQEKEQKPDPTNICSSAEVLAGGDTTFSDLIALAEEDNVDSKQEFSQDVLSPFSHDVSSPISCIDTFNSALDMELLGPEGKVDIDSYSLDLNTILQESVLGLSDIRTEFPADSGDIKETDMVRSNGVIVYPRPNTIGIKSFANVSKVVKKKEKVHFLCILKAQTAFVEILKRINCPSVKGGYKFFLDLLDHVNKLNSGRDRTSVQVALDFIRVEVSGPGVSVHGIDDLNVLRNSNIVIVEDIVDTGRTMAKLVSKLTEYSPKRILIACLLRKRCRVPCYTPDYIGFEVPNKFLVGYALDFNEYFRDLLHICILSQTGLDKYGK